MFLHLGKLTTGNMQSQGMGHKTVEQQNEKNSERGHFLSCLLKLKILFYLILCQLNFSLKLAGCCLHNVNSYWKFQQVLHRIIKTCQSKNTQTNKVFQKLSLDFVLGY